jgi:hypothetical protein
MRIKNALVVGVILLFVGVAVQPSIAVNPISSDNEEDCNICPKVSKTHLVRLKSLINRVETLDKKLSVVSKHNPESTEKYQEISDRITTIKEMSKELITDWKYPIICSFLIISILFRIVKANFYLSLIELLLIFNPKSILATVFYKRVGVIARQIDPIFDMFITIECVEGYFYFK